MAPFLRLAGALWARAVRGRLAVCSVPQAGGTSTSDWKLYANQMELFVYMNNSNRVNETSYCYHPYLTLIGNDWFYDESIANLWSSRFFLLSFVVCLYCNFILHSGCNPITWQHHCRNHVGMGMEMCIKGIRVLWNYCIPHIKWSIRVASYSAHNPVLHEETWLASAE